MVGLHAAIWPAASGCTRATLSIGSIEHLPKGASGRRHHPVIWAAILFVKPSAAYTRPSKNVPRRGPDSHRRAWRTFVPMTSSLLPPKAGWRRADVGRVSNDARGAATIDPRMRRGLARTIVYVELDATFACLHVRGALAARMAVANQPRGNHRGGGEGWSRRRAITPPLSRISPTRSGS